MCTRRLLIAIACAALATMSCRNAAPPQPPALPNANLGMYRVGDDVPDVPKALSADRGDAIVRVTWAGKTRDYDLAQCFYHAQTGWSIPTIDRLRPASKKWLTGKYFISVNALPQPMAFCVRAVGQDAASNWTDWKISMK